MREIKFRVWNTISKIMKPFSEIKRCGVFAIADGLNSDDFIILPLKNSILNEYTGLKDKNDVEIYEGDICRCLGGSEFNGHYEYNRIYEVKWQGSGFEMMIDDCGYGWNYSSGFEYIEVIGNIYENPELLKKINESR